VGGEDAREAADEAEEAALAVRHELGGGLALSIEPTAALTAVDLDWSGAGAGKAALKANLRGLHEAARLLRMKAIGGTIAIDLIGFPGREGGPRRREQGSGFAPDGAQVVVLPVSRLGLVELSKPHREQTLLQRLLAPDGRLSARSLAQRLVRAMEREGRSDPGARVTALVAPEVAAELSPLAAALGPRFTVRQELGCDRLKTDIQLR
jgi:Ribonuclease G/E